MTYKVVQPDEDFVMSDEEHFAAVEEKLVKRGVLEEDGSVTKWPDDYKGFFTNVKPKKQK